MVSYAQVPGVSDSNGSGMGRLGRGLPVLGHVLVLDEVLDAIIEVRNRNDDGRGANPREMDGERVPTKRTVFLRHFIVVQSEVQRTFFSKNLYC